MLMAVFSPEMIMLLPVLFTVFMLVGLAIYWFSGKLAPKANPVGHKMESYAGGEAIEGGNIQMNYNLFHVAVFFSIMHVFVLMLATLLGGSMALVGVIGAIYVVIGLICMIVLLSR